MSLIQQALKRKTEEQQGKIVLPPPPLAATPLAVPPPSVPAPPMPASSTPAHARLSLASPPPPVAVKPPPSMLPPLSPPPVTTPDTPPLLPPLDGPAATHPMPSAPVASPPPLLRSAPPTSSEPSPTGSKKKLVILAMLLLVVFVVAGIQLRGVFSRRPDTGKGLAKPETPTTKGSELTTKVSTKSPAETPPPPPPAAVVPAPPVERPATVNSGESASPGGTIRNTASIGASVEAMKTAVHDSRTDIQPTPPRSDLVKAVPAVGSSTETGDKPTMAISIPTPAGGAAVVQPIPPKPVAPSVPVTWPNVKISGVMARASFGQRSAIVNDLLVNVGESVDGMTLMEVRESSVVMEYKGDTRTFNVGRRQ